MDANNYISSAAADFYVELPRLRFVVMDLVFWREKEKIAMPADAYFRLNAYFIK